MKIDRTKTITKHFQGVDPVIFPVLARMALEPLRLACPPAGYFPKLCREIIGQQLGSGAARAILGRFQTLFPRKRITSERVLAYPEAQLRAIGMSWAKARSIRNLAQQSAEGKLRFSAFSDMDDEAVIADLTQVKGIGRWTAEMFLIFTLGREDVFSFGDLGLRKGFVHLYGRRRAQSKKSMEIITQRWSPYRSYGSLALWHISDTAM